MASIPKVLRAPCLVLLEGSKRVEGASTITQQVAKNFLLGNERTFERKIREALLAFRIEAAYSKDKILELYLNEIFLGLGNYGVAAAALDYYGKSVNELTLSEVAYLAALPKGPNNYHPFRDRDAAIARAELRHRSDGRERLCDRQAGDKAKAEPLNVSPRVLSPDKYAAGYFAEEVRRDLADRYGEKELYEGGLSVHTTLDPKMQVMARKALTDGLVRYDEAHGFRGPCARSTSSRTGALHSPMCRRSATSRHGGLPWCSMLPMRRHASGCNPAARIGGGQRRPRDRDPDARRNKMDA